MEKLRAEPGIVVTDTGKRDGKHFVSGLRDPLARDPATMIQEQAWTQIPCRNVGSHSGFNT